jgi:Reverse transcriptase (RNA-dependent DNA polymerase)
MYPIRLTLDEKVYITFPPGQKNVSNSSLLCKLKNTIYGLKQSPRTWYAKSSLSLLKINFVKSSVYSSIFFKHSQNFIIIILIYVDDIIITGNNNEDIKMLKNI